MIKVSNGEISPRVVLVQTLLNRKGADLDVDGIWGRHTNDAVNDFRSSLGKPAGPVDGPVWLKLVDGTGLKLVDSVDMAPNSGNEGDWDALKEAGDDPIEETRDVGHGVEDAVTRIITRAASKGSIALLRFHGHGHQGQWMTIAIGDPLDTLDGKFSKTRAEGRKAYLEMKADWHSYIDLAHVDKLSPTLRRLNPYFAPFASVEHHGCKIGTNHALLRRLADVWGVPVSGGVGDQLGGGDSTFVFEGRVYTAFPRGLSLRSWSRSVAENKTAGVR